VVQDGQGIGAFFQGLYHLMRPLIVSGLSAIKDEASVSGKNILRDITTVPITKLLADEGNRAIGNLKRRANDQMSGKGVKRSRKSIKKPKRPVKRQSTARKRQSDSGNKKKPRELDIFD
jgi:hypothetical protein